MERAFVLAQKALGFTSPNPVVGAVIVKNGKIVSEGWHKKAGFPHAEVNAINNLMKKSGIKSTDLDPYLFKNAELYVTLEPCCHFGKTAPCTDLLIKAGFKKVNIGMLDPSPKVNGKGVEILKANKISCEILKSSDPLAGKIRLLNQPFLKWTSKNLPYVVMKAGMSLDGKIATKFGASKWITSELAREEAKKERSLFDSVLVGGTTVKTDNPVLTLAPNFKKDFLKIILCKNSFPDFNSKIFNEGKVLVVTSKKLTQKEKIFAEKNDIIIKKFVTLTALLRYLGSIGIQSVFVEGGGTIHGMFYDAFCKNKFVVDKIIFYVSPKIIGGAKSVSVVEGEGVKNLAKIPKLENLNSKIVGEDLRVEGIYNFY